MELSPEKKHRFDTDDRLVFGFWLYMMTDLLMFAVLFAVFAVLSGNNAKGPVGREIFDLSLVLAETLLLLTSSFTSGLGLLAARRGSKSKVFLWFGVTFLLGLAFLALEMTEFGILIREGHTWHVSGFLSSFFALLGTHGLHILFGLLWMGSTLIFIAKRGMSRPILRKLTMLSIFWHFLDIVWIFIFTFVYLRAFV